MSDLVSEDGSADTTNIVMVTANHIALLCMMTTHHAGTTRQW